METNGTTNSKCINGHQWTWGGSPNMNLENCPCDCGKMVYHTEECQCCGSNVLKPTTVGLCEGFKNLTK